MTERGGPHRQPGPPREPGGIPREPGGALREPDGALREPDGALREPGKTLREPDALREPGGPRREAGGVLDSRPAPRGLNRLVRTGWRRASRSRAPAPEGLAPPGAGAAPALRVELVPKTSWYADLRELLDEATWKRISLEVAERAGDRCEICGGRGPRHRPVECHELWRYDDRLRVQALVRVVALCPACHTVEHMGFANLHGGGTQARAHLAHVNGWSLARTDAHIAEAFRVWAQRSQGPWILDLEGLRPYLPAAEYARVARRATIPPTGRR
jgi:hypothetical protein